jgi:hypothetical protein
MTASERLLARLRAMGVDLPEDATICRTYAGRHQRAAGAWTWYAWSATRGNLGGIGSHSTVNELVRAPVISATRAYGIGEDLHVDPCEPGSTGWKECYVG